MVSSSTIIISSLFIVYLTNHYLSIFISLRNKKHFTDHLIIYKPFYKPKKTSGGAMHYHGCCCGRCRVTASPLPVIVMITVALVLLALSSAVKFEVSVSSGEDVLSWLLLAAVPLALLFAVRCLSCLETSKRSIYYCPCGRWRCVCYY